MTKYLKDFENIIFMKYPFHFLLALFLCLTGTLPVSSQGKTTFEEITENFDNNDKVYDFLTTKTRLYSVSNHLDLKGLTQSKEVQKELYLAP